VAALRYDPDQDLSRVHDPVTRAREFLATTFVVGSGMWRGFFAEHDVEPAG
jgi:hypothetical protein